MLHCNSCCQHHLEQQGSWLPDCPQELNLRPPRLSAFHRLPEKNALDSAFNKMVKFLNMIELSGGIEGLGSQERLFCENLTA